MAIDKPQKKIRLQRTAKGKRPQYFSDPTMDKLLSMTLVLMEELSVTRDRLDTVERLIEKHKLFSQDDVENFELTEEIDEIRSERRMAYIARVLKCVQDEIEHLKQMADEQKAVE